MAEDVACQVPLLDLMRAVPADARAEYEHGPTHHQMIPYGRYCAWAVTEIACLAAALADVTAQRDEAQVNSLVVLKMATDARVKADRLKTALEEEKDTANGLRTEANGCREAMRAAVDVMQTEINPLNYNHDDVMALDMESNDAWRILTAALKREPPVAAAALEVPR
jgi:hypothetical protein